MQSLKQMSLEEKAKRLKNFKITPEFSLKKDNHLLMKKLLRNNQINILYQERIEQIADCPLCGHYGKKHSLGIRYLKELSKEKPTLIELTYSKHLCSNYQNHPKQQNKHFNIDMTDIAPPSRTFTNHVFEKIGKLNQTMTREKMVIYLFKNYHVYIPPTTLHDIISTEFS